MVVTESGVFAHSVRKIQEVNPVVTRCMKSWFSLSGDNGTKLVVRIDSCRRHTQDKNRLKQEKALDFFRRCQYWSSLVHQSARHETLEENVLQPAAREDIRELRGTISDQILETAKARLRR